MRRLGRAGLTGWRSAVAGRVAPAVAARTRLREERILDVLGALFFALSVRHVVSTIRRAARM